ncbi:hypothetical protein [Nitrolancea hollandica]|uniref:Uncharacterized protein n=1 Tax=Nitrolancea hollandica Lb TaxID=1129897 RepID=I4EIF8_9BACT|nr:hypothetical protein [Nitrolancea hollandica]CCF84470.1 hypothetical protein NITHO_3430015 [Nitrolancea hollandica Lb]
MLTLNRQSAQRLGGILSRATQTRTDECQKCGGWHVKQWRGRMKSAEYVSKACKCSCCRFSFAVTDSFGFPVL